MNIIKKYCENCVNSKIISLEIENNTPSDFNKKYNDCQCNYNYESLKDELYQSKRKYIDQHKKIYKQYKYYNTKNMIRSKIKENEIIDKFISENINNIKTEFKDNDLFHLDKSKKKCLSIIQLIDRINNEITKGDKYKIKYKITEWEKNLLSDIPADKIILLFMASDYLELHERFNYLLVKRVNEILIRNEVNDSSFHVFKFLLTEQEKENTLNNKNTLKEDKDFKCLDNSDSSDDEIEILYQLKDKNKLYDMVRSGYNMKDEYEQYNYMDFENDDYSFDNVISDSESSSSLEFDIYNS